MFVKFIVIAPFDFIQESQPLIYNQSDAFQPLETITQQLWK